MKTKDIKKEWKVAGYKIIIVDDDVLDTAPRGDVQAVTVFSVGKYVTCDELEREYEKRGLVPANLDSLFAIAGQHDFIATQWTGGAWASSAAAALGATAGRSPVSRKCLRHLVPLKSPLTLCPWKYLSTE